MLVFFIVITIFIVLLVLSSEIAIQIDNLKIKNNKKVECNWHVVIMVFNKKIFKVKIENDKVSKLVNKEKINMKNIDFTKMLESVKYLFSDKIKIKNIELNINIGTGDMLLTTYVVAIISTILSCVLPIYIQGKLKENSYKVLPIFEEELKYEIYLNSIIAIKTVHIIHIIYLNRKKRRDEKNDNRTSNRESYASGYE